MGTIFGWAMTSTVSTLTILKPAVAIFQRGLQEDAGGRALPAWIAGREEGADIAGGDRAQQRIGDGVQEDVAVGVAGEALGVRDGQAANHQRHAGLEGV